MRPPTLSIVMPTYNHGRYIRAAVKSVLDQSYSDFELIVINDGSTDSTQKYLMTLKDPRITIVTHNNRGEYQAVNTGLRLVRGRYVTFMHSDDLLPKQSLAKRIRTLASSPRLNFVHGDFRTIDVNGSLGKVVKAVDWPARKALLTYLAAFSEGKMVFLYHFPTLMFKTTLLEKVGPMDDRLPYAGDMDFMFRLLRQGGGRYIPATLYLYRDHPESSREQYKKQGEAAERKIRQQIAKRYRTVNVP